MKKFEFSLKKMLSYKEQIQEVEKNKLSHLMSNKNKLEDLIAKLQFQSTKLSDEQLIAAKRGMSVIEVKNYAFKLSNNRQYIKQLTDELYKSTLAVEEQLKVVLTATQEVEGLNKLKDKQYQEYVYEDTKAQEGVVLEFVSSKLVRDNNGI